MSKAAFLFPGQGSQYVGMGRSLADQFPSARAVFQAADAALGFAISRLCWEGPAEELQLTENTQPAILTVSTAAMAVLRERGWRPDLVAGHSLGEYSALVAAGAISFPDTVRLVRNRGRYMQEAVPAGVGAMAALLKLPDGRLKSILNEAAQGEVVAAANLNSPDQIVIAGHKGAVERAAELAKEAGARRAVILPVSAPFHCPLMEPAQRRLAADLAATEFRDPEVPVVNNWQARVVRTGTDARQGLLEQVSKPVLWTESMRCLLGLGVTEFVEVGPGPVLAGLLRRIASGSRCVGIGEAADLEKLASSGR